MSNDYYSFPKIVQRSMARSTQVNEGFAAVGTAFDRLPTEDALKEGRVTVGTDSGTADAYVITSAYPRLSYTPLMEVVFLPGNSCTGASTINLDGIGPKPIKRMDGEDPKPGDIEAGVPCILRFAQTTFRITSSPPNDAAHAAASATAAAGSATEAATITNDAATAATALTDAAANSASAAAASMGAASTEASAAEAAKTRRRCGNSCRHRAAATSACAAENSADVAANSASGGGKCGGRIDRSQCRRSREECGRRCGNSCCRQRLFGCHQCQCGGEQRRCCRHQRQCGGEQRSRGRKSCRRHEFSPGRHQ